MNEEFQLTICNVNMLVKKFLKESPVLYKRFNGRYEVESVSLLDESVKYYYCPTYNEIWQQKLSVTLINTENGTKQTCKFNGKIDQFPILIVKDNSGLGGVPYYSRENGRSLVVLEDLDFKFVPVTVTVKLRDFHGAVINVERLETFGDPEITGNTYTYTSKTICVSGQYNIRLQIDVIDAEIYEKYSYTVNYMDPDTLMYVSEDYTVTDSQIDIYVPYVIDDVTITLTATELPKTYLSLRSFGNLSISDYETITVDTNRWYGLPPNENPRDSSNHRRIDSQFNIEDEAKFVNVDIGHNVNQYQYLAVGIDTSVYKDFSYSFYQNGDLSVDNVILASAYDENDTSTHILDCSCWDENSGQTNHLSRNILCVGYAQATWEEFGDRLVSYLNPKDGDVFISEWGDYDIYIYHSNSKSWSGKNINLGDALIYKKFVYIKVYNGPYSSEYKRWWVDYKMKWLLSCTNYGIQQTMPSNYIVFYIAVNNLASIAHNLIKLQVFKNTHHPTVTVNIYDYIGVQIERKKRADIDASVIDPITTTLITTLPGRDYDFTHLKQSAEYKLNDISGEIKLKVSNLPVGHSDATTWFYKVNNINHEYKEIHSNVQESDFIRITTDTTIDIFVNKIVGIDMLMNTNDTNLVLYDIIETPSLYPVEWNETYTTKVIDGSIDRWKFRIWKGDSPFTRIAPQIQIFKNSKPLERVWPEVYPTYYDFNENGYVDIPALGTYINEDREVIADTSVSGVGDNIGILPSIKSYVMTFTGLYKFRHKKVIFKLSYHNEQDESFFVNDISLDDFEIQLNGMSFITPFNEPMISSSYNNKTLSWELDMPKYQYYININMIFPNKTVINTDDDYYAEYEEPIYYNKSYFALQNGVNYNYKSYNSNEVVDYLSNSTALMDEETRTLSIKIPITRFRDSVNDDEFIEIEAVREFVQLYNLEVYPDQNSQANVLVVKDVSIYDDNDKTEVTLPHTFTTLMEHPTSLKIELSSNEPIKCPTGHIVYTSDNNIALDAIVAYPYTLYVNNSNYKTFFSTNTANLKMTSIVRSYHIDFSMPDDGHDVIVKNHLTWEKDILLNNRSFPRKNGYFYSMYETPETTNNSIDVDVKITGDNTDNWINIIVYCSNNMDDLYDYPVIYTRAKYLTRQKRIIWTAGGNIENGEQLHTTIPFEDAVWRFHFFTTDI